jgi:peptide/nickel transport system substrate-binding protein
MTRAAILLSACLAATALGGASAQEPVRGGRLNLVTQPEPATLNIAINGQQPTHTVGDKIYEGLLAYGRKQEPLPRLAESWSIMPDGLTYVFHLRRRAKWHDGTPFTAADVVFSLAVLNPSLNAVARQVFDQCDTVKALDNYTVEIKLKRPFAPLLSALDVDTFPILPKHLYEGTDYRNNPNNNKPIGTGPFKLSEWRRGQFIQLVRNDDYWAPGKPYLDEIYFSIIPDAQTRAQAFESGQVDALIQNDVQPIDVPRLRDLPGVSFTTDGFERWSPTSLMEFNLRKPPMSDVRFRRAVYLALDRDFIADTVWYGLAQAATGPLPSPSPFKDMKVTQYPYNLDAARHLLDEMGLKPGPDGVRVSVRLAPQPYGETWTRFGEYARQQLRQIGIKAELEPTDPASWSKKLSDWDFDLAMTNWYPGGDPGLSLEKSYSSRSIIKGSPFNNSEGYSDAEVDDLLVKGAQENDDAARRAIYGAIQRKLAADVPVAWLVEVHFPVLYRSRVHNFVTLSHTPADSLADVWVGR